MRAEAPPLARIEAVRRTRAAGRRRAGVRDPRQQRASGSADALVVADSAPCEDCLAELADPADRRYRYPFINCTNCGPRFTIVRDVPYDRPLTTMAGFAMCPACRREYEDPRDRRFHAQPNACPALRAAGDAARRPPASAVAAADPIAALAARLAAGAIAAVKGLGGYHLVCDAADEAAVAALRARKHREDKPFALMVADADGGGRADRALGDRRGRCCNPPARPIVLAARRPARRWPPPSRPAPPSWA